MRIVILTGSETRHVYFRKKMASDTRIKVLTSYCESDEKSLAHRNNQNEHTSQLEIQHTEARAHSEIDFFSDYIESCEDKSNPKSISKGAINDKAIVDEIVAMEPDLLVCYGSSLIKSDLLTKFDGKFLNVHLGLSPYYRGSGTNVWPLINLEPDMVGATFMYIDAGIDTGKIIHQIRADVYLGDSPHTIGNRLIRKMTSTYAEIVCNFRNNKARVMGKDRLERAVPFIHSGIKLQIYPLFTFLKQYLEQKALESNDLIFPEYASGKHVSSGRPKLLSKHISNMRSDYDSRQAVPYSLRHTFKDRYQAAGVPAQIGEYIMGHKTKKSSKVYEKYGTGMPIQMMVDYITDITEVQEHGFFEEYD